MIRLLAPIAAASLLLSPAAVHPAGRAPAAAAQPDPAELLRRANAADGFGFGPGTASVTLLIEDPGGESRERHLEVRTAPTPEGPRFAVRVTAPAEVAGQAYLFVSAAAGDQAWVYLPALDDAPRRVNGAQLNGSFLGSHLAFADLLLEPLRLATPVSVSSDKVGATDAWLLNLTYRSGPAAGARVWLRKSDALPVRLELIDDDEQLIRSWQVEQTESSAGRDVVRRYTIRPARGGATIVVVDKRTPTPVPDAASLTPASLVN